MSNLEVMKFGGSSLDNAEHIWRVTHLINDYKSCGQVVVVASAMQGITNQLVDITQHRQEPDYNERQNLDKVHALFGKHYQTLDELKLSIDERQETRFGLNLYEGNLANHLRQSNWDQTRHADYTVSYGERLSSLLIAAALRDIGVPALAINASECLVAERIGTDTKVITEKSCKRASLCLLPLLEDGIIPIVSGFYASDGSGNVIILGRGGSDYTATALANILEADMVTLWKEVDGVFDKDPHLGDAELYQHLSYKKAAAMARNGAKILHYLAIEPVADSNIPVRVRNTFAPDNPGTIIGNYSAVA